METKIGYSDKIYHKFALNKTVSITIRFIVSAIILYFIVSLVQWKNVISAFRIADIRFIIISFSLLFLNICIRTFKWHVMLRSVKNEPTYRETFGSLMLGISLGSFTPAEIGEYAGRTLHVTDAKRSHIVGLVLLDKAQIFIITSLFGLISIMLLTIDKSYIIISLSVFLSILSVFLFFNINIIGSIGHYLNTSLFKKSLITKILDGFTILKRKQLYTTFYLTIAFQLVVLLQMFFLISSFSEITITNAFIATSAMMFVKSVLPISLSDLGVREASSIFFFSMFGVPDASSLNASLLLFMINVFIPSLAGLYFLRDYKLSFPNIVQFLNKKEHK